MELLLSLGPESIWEVGHIVDMVKEMIIYREPTWKMLQSLEKWHDLLKEILQEGHRHKYSDLFWISTVGSTLTEMHKIQKEKEGINLSLFTDYIIYVEKFKAFNKKLLE